jgi:hypothetical protein
MEPISLHPNDKVSTNNTHCDAPIIQAKRVTIRDDISNTPKRKVYI